MDYSLSYAAAVCSKRKCLRKIQTKSENLAAVSGCTKISVRTKGRGSQGYVVSVRTEYSGLRHCVLGNGGPLPRSRSNERMIIWTQKYTRYVMRDRREKKERELERERERERERETSNRFQNCG